MWLSATSFKSPVIAPRYGADPATVVRPFGTSGYRTPDAATGFTQPIVQQLTAAIADYVLANPDAAKGKPILVSYDRRAVSAQFAPKVAQWLKDRGLHVYLMAQDTPIPVAALAARSPKLFGINAPQTLGCVYIGASHNPPEHAGFNFLTPEGAVIPTHQSKQVESLQFNPTQRRLDQPGEITLLNPYEGYKQHVKNTLGIDFKAMAKSGLKVFYDPLYATGRKFFPQLLKDEGVAVETLHADDTPPSDWKGMPNPTEKELATLAKQVKAAHQAEPSRLTIGLGNDGDADRFALVDEQGRFIPPNDVMLLVLHLLQHHRQAPEKGAIVRNQSTTHLLDAIAKQQGWELVQTPVGYKFIAEEFIDRDKKKQPPVILGGESSGGLSIHGHIPEKDGLLANLLLAELVAKEKQPISQILNKIKAGLPERREYHEWSLKTDQGDVMMAQFETLRQKGGSVAGIPIDHIKTLNEAQKLKHHFGTMDGVKLYLSDGSWVLFRKSGTEPLVRFAIEAVPTTDNPKKLALLTDALKQQFSA